MAKYSIDSKDHKGYKPNEMKYILFSKIYNFR